MPVALFSMCNSMHVVYSLCNEVLRRISAVCCIPYASESVWLCYVSLLPPPFTLVGPPLPGVCASWPWHSGERLMSLCHVFVQAHVSCDCCCRYCIILFTLLWDVDVMYIICTFAGTIDNSNCLWQNCPTLLRARWSSECMHCSVAMLFTRGAEVTSVVSHIVGTTAVCMTSGTDYLSVYVPHLLYTFSVPVVAMHLTRYVL